ncbi:MAG: hypothetical protein IRF12RH_01145 [Rickettsia helvetica]|uniref:Guanosine polyphosphate pyrophosphohydrolase/synthetase n=1 Tax=Rickettsia helvetica TaxID=35789 RepID=A0ABM9NA81_RICHE
MLAEFVADAAPKLYTSNMINAALLHDTIEDTERTEKMIIEIFGKEIAKHVEGLTRIKPHGKISAEESLNLLIKQKRYDTALIKLFDRIHNVQTLGAKSPEKAKKIIVETFKKFLVVAIHLECYEIEEKFIDDFMSKSDKSVAVNKAFSIQDEHNNTHKLYTFLEKNKISDKTHQMLIYVKVPYIIDQRR